MKLKVLYIFLLGKVFLYNLGRSIYPSHFKACLNYPIDFKLSMRITETVEYDVENTVILTNKKAVRPF